MKIIISNGSNKPIYEQITDQIKDMILSGELSPGDNLPGMRSLAKDLKISVITTKRAYNDLEELGFIETVVGKGSFVAGKNVEILREEQLKLIEDLLQKTTELAKVSKVSLEELQEILDVIYRGE
ncbi:MAG: GntR family transcriptional regulator [Tissierellia bacterium]|nr:GntR family transcriptional regulator [Tissierellia bacterium]